MQRLTENVGFDPWEMCGQDAYCKRGCHEPGGCTSGCVVPKLYRALRKYENIGLCPEQIEQIVKRQIEDADGGGRYILSDAT